MKHMWSEEEIASQKKDISTLVDSKGNPRFIEGNGTPLSQEGVTISYCKWSLSGTHLMLVCAGTLADTTVINSTSILANYELPDFVINKIYPVWQNNLDYRINPVYAYDGSSQNVNFFVEKTSNSMQFKTNGTLTLSKQRSFRIQFDLLIDSE